MKIKNRVKTAKEKKQFGAALKGKKENIIKTLVFLAVKSPLLGEGL